MMLHIQDQTLACTVGLMKTINICQTCAHDEQNDIKSMPGRKIVWEAPMTIATDGVSRDT